MQPWPSFLHLGSDYMLTFHYLHKSVWRALLLFLDHQPFMCRSCIWVANRGLVGWGHGFIKTFIRRGHIGDPSLGDSRLREVGPLLLLWSDVHGSARCLAACYGAYIFPLPIVPFIGALASLLLLCFPSTCMKHLRGSP